MAIKLNTQYPDRTTVDGSNPNGTFKNSAPPGSLNGTPGDFAWAKDMWSFLEILMSEGGVVHNDVPDDATASQRYDALVKLARDFWPIWSSTHEYGQGVIAIGSDGAPYYSLQSANVNHDPVSNPAWWQNFSIEALESSARNVWPLWDSANTYPKGVGVVGSDGNPYYSLQAANFNHDPISNPTWWQLFEYSALKSDSRNVWPVWDVTNSYIQGAIAIASDSETYQSLQTANLAHDPISSPAWWVQFSPGLVSSATQNIQGISYLPQYGLIANNSANPTTGIDFYPRRYTFESGDGEAVSPLYVKTLDSNPWAPGNGTSVLDVPPAVINSWYAAYVIYNPTSGLSDYLLTASFGSPALPAGYTEKRYIGDVRTGATAILSFKQIGRVFRWDVFAPDIYFGTAPISRAMSPLLVPPRNSIEVIINGHVRGKTGGGRAVIFTDPNQFNQLPNITTAFSLRLNQGGAQLSDNGGQFRIMCDNSGQIGVRANSPGVEIWGLTLGWKNFDLERV